MTGTPVPPKEAIREEDIEQEEEAAAETPTSVDSSTAEGFAAALAAAAASNSSTIPKDQTAARHTCPKCERTWPKHFGAVCFNCQRDVELAQRREKFWAELWKEGNPPKHFLDKEAEEAPPAPPAPPPPVSKTTRRLRASARGESWLNHQGLDQLIGNRDLREVCELIGAMGSRLPPEPEDFFEDYDRHLQDHKQLEADYLAPFPKPANNGATRLAA